MQDQVVTPDKKVSQVELDAGSNVVEVAPDRKGYPSKKSMHCQTSVGG